MIVVQPLKLTTGKVTPINWTPYLFVFRSVILKVVIRRAELVLSRSNKGSHDGINGTSVRGWPAQHAGQKGSSNIQLQEVKHPFRRAKRTSQHGTMVALADDVKR
jgi:hypothetical protein